MSINPFLNRVAKRDSGHHGRVSEKATAKRLGGNLTPGSGALVDAKADFHLGQFLVENKATTSRSYTLKADTLAKVYQEALELGKIPALSIQFTNEAGKSEKRERWVCIPEATFAELVGE